MLDVFLRILLVRLRCRSSRRQKYGEVQTAEFWCLGLGEPWPISGLHGDGVRRAARR
ncbi:unnamed protein product, partial [Hapterophycus canaliculatus]